MINENGYVLFWIFLTVSQGEQEMSSGHLRTSVSEELIKAEMA